MRVKCAIAHAVVDCILLFVYVKGYFFGIDLFNRVFAFHFWFTDVLYGIFGVAYTIALAKFVYPVVCVYLKSIDLYALCNSDCNSFVSASAGVMSKFTSTAAIVTFNKLIRTCISEMADRIEPGQPLKDFFSSIENTLLLKSAKWVKGILTLAFDYVDECILGYCYCHDEKLGTAAIKGFSYFVSDIGNIGIKTFSAVVVEKIVMALYTIVYVLVLWKRAEWSLPLVIEYYLVYQGIRFVLKDAVLEPSLRNAIVRQFSISVAEKEAKEQSDSAESASYSAEDAMEFAEGAVPEEMRELVSQIPVLQQLLDYNGKGKR